MASALRIRHHRCCRLSNLGILDGFLLAWETPAEPTEAQWFNVPSALWKAVLGPILALSVTKRRLLLAAILAMFAAVAYVAPLGAFFIGIMTYGF